MWFSRPRTCGPASRIWKRWNERCQKRYNKEREPPGSWAKDQRQQGVLSKERSCLAKMPKAIKVIAHPAVTHPLVPPVDILSASSAARRNMEHTSSKNDVVLFRLTSWLGHPRMGKVSTGPFFLVLLIHFLFWNGRGHLVHAYFEALRRWPKFTQDMQWQIRASWKPQWRYVTCNAPVSQASKWFRTITEHEHELGRDLFRLSKASGTVSWPRQWLQSAKINPPKWRDHPFYSLLIEGRQPGNPTRYSECLVLTRWLEILRCGSQMTSSLDPGCRLDSPLAPLPALAHNLCAMGHF